MQSASLFISNDVLSVLSRYAYSSGIGYQTTAQLALHGAKVYLACRTESKALAAIARIEKENPILKGTENLIWTPLDLSSISSAKAAAEEILVKETRLDLLGTRTATRYGL